MPILGRKGFWKICTHAEVAEGEGSTCTVCHEKIRGNMQQHIEDMHLRPANSEPPMSTVMDFVAESGEVGYN